MKPFRKSSLTELCYLKKIYSLICRNNRIEKNTIIMRIII